MNNLKLENKILNEKTRKFAQLQNTIDDKIKHIDKIKINISEFKLSISNLKNANASLNGE